jgi:hypothetical protein
VPFQNEVRGTRQEWWRVVKINPRGKLQTRLIGVDLIYVYNKIPADKRSFFHDRVRNPRRAVKDIRRIELPEGSTLAADGEAGAASSLSRRASSVASSSRGGSSEGAAQKHAHRSSSEAVFPFAIVFRHDGDADETRVSYRAYSQRDRTEIVDKIQYIRNMRRV